MKRTAMRRLQSSFLGALVVSSVVALPATLATHAAAAAPAAPVHVGHVVIPGAKFVQGSLSTGVLDGGGTSVLVGSDGTGRVYALHASDLSPAAGWAGGVALDGNPIESTPSVADTNGDGQNEVFVGTGTDESYNKPSGRGGLWSISHDGAVRWMQTEPTPGVIGGPTYPDAPVFSTPTIGDATRSGVPDVYAGTLGLQSWAFTESGTPLGGWPFYQNDTIYSSPAMADVNGDGQPDFVIGGDASPAPNGDQSTKGGRMRAVSGGGQLLWEFRTNEVIISSPAIADLDGTGEPQIAFGTGDYWYRNGGATDATKFFILHNNGALKCSQDLGQIARSSPAIGDLAGNGRFEIAVGGELNNAGQVVALDRNCNVLWKSVPVGGAVFGGVVTADVTGAGHQDVLAGTAVGVSAFDGKTGATLFTLSSGASYQNAPLVLDEGGGKLAIFAAGFDSNNNGIIDKWEVQTGAGLGALSWPMFHKDSRHTGSWTNPPLAQSLCPPPGGGGYWMSASDGGVFSFCDAKFLGSTGAIHLTRPMVAIAHTPTNKGYWEAASDGGIFAFGDAGFFGSTGAIALNRPIVGMAPTPSGRGYWLVASDGGIFTFGDAVFAGSTGALKLNRPIVGMAPTPSGRGYWLVASDGGIFAFGDAVFAGSTGALSLNRPIVSMARTRTGRGYWLAASDGGIFAFGDAVFQGSTGAIKLNQPIVGMTQTASGNGYWLVASDGGIFSFGDAAFLGSTGAIKLNQPIVGMSAVGT